MPEFPFWSCWRGTSGLNYGRRKSEPSEDSYYVRGEDPVDLRDQIIRPKRHGAAICGIVSRGGEVRGRGRRTP